MNNGTNISSSSATYEFVSVNSIGLSYEGRELRVLSLCWEDSDCTASDKPAVYIQASETKPS